LKLNQEREEQGLTPAANPRNAAAGTIRTLEPNIVAQRRLDFYAYLAMQNGENIFLSKRRRSMRWRTATFLVNPHRQVLRTGKSCLHSLKRRSSNAKPWATKSTA